MILAFPGRTPSTFEIKSANLPLIALLLKSTDLTLLSQELEQRFADAPAFFDDDPLVLDLTPLGTQTASIDFGRLLELLRRWKMAPIAFKGAGPAHAAAARAAGLVSAPDAEMHRTVARTFEPSGSAGVSTAAQAARDSARLAPPPQAPGALVISKQVRSGQQIYAKGRDLVVLATVNVGAEVIADGHIHVYGMLRGKAIAGARGNTDARIFTFGMEAELIAIAGTYRTSETALPPEIHGRPTQIQLQGDKLMMEPLTG